MTKFQLKKSDLLSRLLVLNKIIPTKPVFPVMSCILFELDKDKLHLSATDNTAGQIKAAIDVQSDDTISFCLEAKLLIEALRTLPEQPLIFEVNESNLNTIIRYHGGKFEMIAQQPDEVLNMKDVAEPVEVDLPLDTFINGIAKTIICAADDELRPIMNSVFIEISNGQINHVASDGKILSLIEHKDENLTEKISFVLPQKIASILRATFVTTDPKNIKLFIGTDRVRFEYELYSIVAQLLEGRFPNYRSIIPTNNDKTVTLSASALKDALSRVLVFSSQASHLVKFTLSTDSLTIAGQDVDYSTCADEKIDCEYSGAPFKIGFNGTSLGKILSTIDCDNVTLSFSTPNKATLLYPTDNNETESITCLSMPMTLND